MLPSGGSPGAALTAIKLVIQAQLALAIARDEDNKTVEEVVKPRLEEAHDALASVCGPYLGE